MNKRVAFVTGGSSGIGQAIVLALAKEGYDLAIGYQSHRAAAEKIAEQAKKFGSQTFLTSGDLADENNVKKIFKEILDKFGKLDVLVNVAGGIPEDGEIPDTSYRHWVKVFDANIFSTALCSQEAVKIMEKQQEISKIINISSVLGETHGGRAGAIAYSAAKAAIINFTQTLAAQYAPKILVNAISPGRTLTPYYDKFSPAELEEKKSVNKTGRFIRPDEIAQMTLAVINNESMVGETVSVNAGFFL